MGNEILDLGSSSFCEKCAKYPKSVLSRAMFQFILKDAK